MNLQPQHFVLSTCFQTVVPDVVGVCRRGVAAARQFMARLVVVLAIFAATQVGATTFTVTSTGTSSTTSGTLAWAIAQANATAGVDTINFAITGTAPYVINMAATTLAITEGVTIDGFTQSGASLGNLMAGTQHTIKVQVNSTSTVFRASANGVTIRGLAIGGVTSTTGYGIQVQTAGNNDLIEGCYIGLAADGSTASSINQNGIRIEAGSSVIIRNCVVANCATGTTSSGIYLGSATTGALVENCFVGTKATGLTAAANGAGAAAATLDLGGIEINGGTATVQNNLVSGNSGVGISNAAATGTQINNNIVGLNLTKTAALPNTSHGIQVTGGNTITIQGNVVSGNTGTGIYLFESGTLDVVTVDSNAVGTSVRNGTLSLGNHQGGIYVDDDIGNGSVISNNTVAFNDQTGTPTGTASLITAGQGLFLGPNSVACAVQITANSFYSNSGIGIDIRAAGVTVNDSGDADTGPNDLLNFPVLSTASITGSNLVVSGYARAGNIVEVFIADGDTGNFGEGKTFLFSKTEGNATNDSDTTTGTYTNPVNALNQGADTTNKFTFTVPLASLPVGVGGGMKLTATATTAAAPKKTSEFSGVVAITGPSNDYGDWNGSGAATATTTSVVNSLLRLGATVDTEASVAPDAAASADGTDEDGVMMPTSITQGASVTIPVTVFNNTGSNAYLNAWIDLNGDGTFNDTLVTSGGERLEAVRTIASSPTASVQNITFTVPNTASTGSQRGVRFRLTNQATTAPTGAVGNGEIEDYVVTIASPVLGVGNLVWLDANDNGRFDVGEGVSGVTVQMLNTSNTVVASTTTDTLGFYQLTTTTPGTYYLKIPASEFASGKPLNGKFSMIGSGNDNGRDDNFDENGIDDAAPATNGIKTANFPLAAGAEPTDTQETGQNGTWDDGLSGRPLDANCDLTKDFAFTVCSQTNVLINGSFETANPTTLTFSNRFPNPSTDPIISYNSYTAWFDKVANWSIDAGAYINDSTHATEGNRFVYFANNSVCIQQLINIGATTTTNSIVPGNAYTLSFDWAPFDYTQPTGSASTSSGAYVELYYIDPSGVKSDVQILTWNSFYDPATDDLAAATRPLAAWSNLTWRKARAQFILPPAPAGRTQLRLWITGAGTGKILVDNVALTAACNVQMCSVGNVVFRDTNSNGIKDASEVGIDNVYLSLYKRMSDGSDVEVATTVTHDGGQYFFSGIVPGNYFIYLDSSNFTSTGAWWTSNGVGTLNGLISSPGNYDPNVTADNAVDDGDKGIDDAAPGTNGISTPVFALGLGTEPTTGSSAGDTENGVFKDLDLVDDANGDMTIDLGFRTAGGLDFGDLPDTSSATAAGNYQTLLANNGPRHTIIAGLKIGALVDAESDGAQSLAADGDGSDDDGITTMPTFVIGQASPSFPVAVTNTTGTASKLSIWIDFNNNGSFEDAGEKVVADLAVANGATSVTVPSFTVPSTAYAAGKIGMRLRLSNTASLTSLGAAASGEVEDYLIQISQKPNCTSSLFTYNVIVRNNLSTTSDIEGPIMAANYTSTTTATLAKNLNYYSASSQTVQIQNSVVASGSAMTVQYGSLFVPSVAALNGRSVTYNNGGSTQTSPVPDFASVFASIQTESAGYAAMNSNGTVSVPTSPAAASLNVGTLNSDGVAIFNVDGNTLFNNSNVQQLDINLNSTTPVGILINVSGTSISYNGSGNMVGNLVSTSWRPKIMWNFYQATSLTLNKSIYGAVLAPYASISATAGAVEGSVAANNLTSSIEVHLPFFTGMICRPTLDYGDHIYGTLAASSASQTASLDVRIGTNPTDVESADPSDANANKDNAAGINDEDLTMPTFPSGVTTNLVIPVTVTPANLMAGTATINVFVDWNGDGVVTGTNETLTAQTVSASGNYTFALTPPAATIGGTKYLRIRITEGGTAPAFAGSSTLKGEVEDYAVQVVNILDFGDWNGSGAATTSTSSVVNNNLRLGALVDTEASVVSNAAATTDDTTGSADEDGVTMPASITIGSSVTIPVNVFNSTGSNAFLNAWIDFNNDGTFNDTLVSSGGERLEAARTIATGATATTQNISFTVPTTASAGTLRGVRFRLTNQATTPPTGSVGSGEVEDYVVTIACPTITLAPATLTNATVGTAYSQATAFSVSGGASPYSWGTPTGIPAGMSWDATNKKLIGTPTSAGSGNIGLSVTDASGCTGSLSVPFTRVCPALTVGASSASPLALTRNSTMSTLTFTASGGTAPYSWGIAGTMPAGLTWTGAVTSTTSTITGTPTTVQSSTLTITATDANGCAVSTNYTINVGCNTIALAPASVGPFTQYAAITNVTFSSTGNVGTMTWGAAGLPAGLTMSTAGVLSGTPTASPGTYSATITATDSQGCPGTGIYSIVIGCPTVTVTTSSLPNGTVGTAYTPTTLTASTAGTGVPAQTYTWSVSPALPSGLSLSTGGVLSGTPAVATALTNYTFTASNQTSCSGFKVLSFSTSCPTITALPTTLPFAYQSQTYNQPTAFTASGVSGSFNWVASGVPTGLTFNASTQKLEGIPTSTTTVFNVTFTATSASYSGCSGSVTVPLRVCPNVRVLPATIAAAVVGSSYSQTFVQLGSAVTPITFSATGLPAWATLDPSTGTLTGIPTSTATVNFTITATDPNGCTGSTPYSLTPTCPTITMSPTTTPLANGTIGSSYSGPTYAASTSASGSRTWSYSISSGALPSGMTLNPTTGALGGTPTVTGVFSFAVRGSDQYGCFADTPSISLRICPVITVTPSAASPLALTRSSAMSTLTFTASGGASAYTWGISGTLPAGLTWTPSVTATTATITGTPTTVQSSTLTITATDSNGCPGNASFTISVGCPQITLAPSSVGPFTQYAAITNVTFSATGNVGTTTWAATSLPSGLSLSTSGLLSGTPTANPGTYTATVTATDSQGCPGSAAYNIVIGCPTVNITTSSLPSGTVGTAYTSTTLAASTSGTSVPAQTYTWSVSPALPTGMSLTTAGVLSGTPSVTTALTSYTFTATNQTSCAGTRVLSFSTSCPTIVVTPGSLLQSTVGTAYTQTSAPAASGISGTFNWAASGLPSGVSINTTTGVLSTTTAAAVGVYPITVTATSASYPVCPGSWSGNFRVCPVINVALSGTAATVGTAFSQTVSASGGTAAYTYAVNTGALPTWATLNTSTGAVTGTPNSTASATFTLKATDANGCIGTSASFTITPVCPTINVAPGAALQSIFGTAYTQTTAPVASGISGTYTWALSGSPPAGMTVNGSTGALSTTTSSPVGLYAITVAATSASYPSCAGAWSGSFRVCPVINVALSSTAATVGTAFSQTVSASGGTAAYTYAVNSGALPAWATLNTSTGAITGLPTNTTSATFTLKATDVNGCVGISSSYIIAPVCPTMSLAPSGLGDAFVNNSYSAALSVTGGTAPYAWSISPGALPAGLSLGSSTSASNIISGVPTAAIGNYGFTVRVVDTYGCVSTMAYTLPVRSLRVGNLVWSDTNNNGVRDAGEPGISGVSVALWRTGANAAEEDGGGDDVQIGSAVVTDSNGGYQFSGLTSQSNYYLRIAAPPLTNAVTGGTPVTQDNGVDNDNNGIQTQPAASLRSPVFALVSGTEPPAGVDGDDTDGDMTIDFGLTPTVCVGNIVFNDVDHNGYYNTGDVLLDGVTVKAFASGDDPLTASPVAVTVTSGGGLYRLCLRPGSYFLHIPPSDFVSLLSGMYPTLAPATGPVNNLDDNADQNLLPSTKPYAFGCNTGVFTLAVGGAPTAASGETGYQASSDDSYDMNSNLTIDLGFYAFPVASAPLAGRVRRDLTGSGDATATTAPATGVEVALYEDTNANGVLDVTEMTALQTAVTDTAGSYVFDPVLPGDYLVVQALPAGSTATFDTDGGDAACTCVKAEGKPVDGIDFMQTGVADTFAQWQKANTDSDADQYDALMEYALGTSPSGFSRPRFWVEARAEGTADAVVVRQSGGHADINFKLEVSSDLKAWSRSALNPAIAANNDGTETLRFRDLNSPFVRLKVELDADFNGDPEQVSVSPVYGWAERQIPVGQQTFSMPLLRTAVFIGRASEATGRDFASGRHYFAEVISGNDEGRRFEIDEAGSDATHIAYQSGQPAADARIAIRPHWTVGELFPPDRFHGNSSASSADRVMTYDGTAYRTLWLLASDSGNRWVSGDALTAAPEGGTIIGPTEGVMLQPKLVPVKLQLVGEVRTWSLWQPLRAGAQFLGTGYPLTMSPSSRAMTAAAGFMTGDTIYLWSGDQRTGAAGFTTYRFQEAVSESWGNTTKGDGSTQGLFEPYRASYLWSGSQRLGWQIMLP